SLYPTGVTNWRIERAKWELFCECYKPLAAKGLRDAACACSLELYSSAVTRSGRIASHEDTETRLTEGNSLFAPSLGLRYSDETFNPARRPSAGAMPGRCGFCLRGETHRPTYFCHREHREHREDKDDGFSRCSLYC